MIFATAAQFLFAAIFLWTGVAKLMRGPQVEMVLVKLLGMRPFEIPGFDSRRMVRLLAAYEIGLALAIGLRVPGARWLAVTTMAAFFVVVVRAWWLHVDCGCFPDRRPSEVGSVVRTGALLVLAVAAAWVGDRPTPGGRDLLAASGLAILLGAAVALLHRIAAELTAGDSPRRPPHPTVIHVVIANQISQDRGGRQIPQEAADEDGWLTADVAAGLARLPVSTLMSELVGTQEPAGALLAIGSAPAFSVATTRGTRPDGAPLLVGLFSSTCKRCPTHIDTVRESLGQPGGPEALMIIAGPSEPAAPFVEAFSDRAAVALVDFDDPLIDSFAIFEFPAFYLLDAQGQVVSAAHEIDDLVLQAR